MVRGKRQLPSPNQVQVSGLTLDPGDPHSLGPLGCLLDVELDPVALLEGSEAFPLDGSKVNENVLAIVLGYKSVTLGVVEPLNGALVLHDVPH